MDLSDSSKPLIYSHTYTHNDLPYMHNLMSVLDHFSDKIIVVDDESTDGTVEFLKEIPKVQIISHKWNGMGEHMSLALKDTPDDTWFLRIGSDEVPTMNFVINIRNNVQVLDDMGVDRAILCINHLTKFDRCKTELGWEMRLVKKNPTVKFVGHGHEELVGNFKGNCVYIPREQSLVHFKFLDKKKINASLTEYVKKGIYDKKHIESRLRMSDTPLAPEVQYPITTTLREYLNEQTIHHPKDECGEQGTGHIERI